MEHVSLARHAYRVSMLEDVHRLWESYWQGAGSIGMSLPTGGCRQEFHSGVLWEYLIEGSLEKIDA